MEKVLFARVGYMKRYAGPQPGDLKPVGGGKFNKEDLGNEAFNFKNIDGCYYGYFRPAVKVNNTASTVELGRIDPAAKDLNRVDGVTVVFFSTMPGRRQAVVVGWYSNATVFREYQPVARQLAARRRGFPFNLRCAAKDAVLLDEDERFILYRTDGGGAKQGRPGTANVFYTLTERGLPKSNLNTTSPWLDKTLKKIRAHRRVDAAPDLEAAAEKELRGGSGQGRQMDIKSRKAIEAWAMAAAQAYYENQNYEVKDVSLKQPYDFECRKKKGRAVLRVEVKGTTSKGDKVILTRSEVASANRHSTALFVLHSIVLKKGCEPQASEGIPYVLPPGWKPDPKALTPIAYEYQLPAVAKNESRASRAEAARRPSAAIK